MASDERPDILILSVDTMRRDAMAPYGADLMPEATRLLEEGVAFDRAIATAGWTGASFGSAFTGRWPSEHGCSSNHAHVGAAPTITPLRGDMPILWDLLSRAGYHVAHGQGNTGYLGPGGGFLRDVDAHNMRFLDRALGKPARALAALTEAGLASGLAYAAWYLRKRRSAEMPHRCPLTRGEPLVRSARRLVRQAPADRPLCLWVNLMDMHDPYEAPRRWMPPEEAPRGRVRPVHLRPHRHPDDTLDEADRAYVRRRYDNTARYSNHCIVRLMEAWRMREDRRSRLTVFFSDHGEEFWDHGSDRHDPTFYHRGVQHGHTFFGEQIHVPFVVHWPDGGLAAGRRESLVSLIDLAPTLADLLGLEAGDSPTRGRSLKALLEGGDAAGDPDRIVFAESTLWGPERKAALSATHKLVRRPDTGEEELYAWGADDPEEKVNLAGSPAHAAEQAALAAAMDAWRADLEGTSPSEAYSEDEEAEVAERLRELGYM